MLPPENLPASGLWIPLMRWDELVLLMEGISPRVARRRRYQTEVVEQEKNGKTTVNHCEKFGYTVNFQ